MEQPRDLHLFIDSMMLSRFLLKFRGLLLSEHIPIFTRIGFIEFWGGVATSLDEQLLRIFKLLGT
jgi:hypothetical protein